MVRLTNKDYSLVDETDVAQAIKRLTLYENMHFEIALEQTELSKQLSDLREENKQKTVQFRELMIKKLNNLNLINTFKYYGIDDK